LFKLGDGEAKPTEIVSFNLLGEILFVQAPFVNVSIDFLYWFQSLGRDSVCSSRATSAAKSFSVEVSISWARFCLFKRDTIQTAALVLSRFNLLGEILFVQAQHPASAISFL